MSEKTYNLSLKDRVNLIEILPREGNVLTYRIVCELQSALSFSEAEIAEYEITYTEVGTSGRFRTTWNEKGTTAIKAVKIGPNGESIIIKRLKDLNERGVCPFAWMYLFEWFVEKKEKTEVKQQ